MMRIFFMGVVAFLFTPSQNAFPCEPVIDTNPADQVVCENENVAISCTVTGASLVYQWRVNDGAITNDATYSNADSDTLTISNASYSLNENYYSCYISNVCGSVTTEQAILIVVTQVVSACTPTIINSGNYDTGIDRVQFVDIDNAHTANDNDGLSDFTCSGHTMVIAGSTNTLTVTLNNGNPEYCRVYLDYDNSGTFEVGEIIYDASSTFDGVHTADIAIPLDTEIDTLLRMRVISDFNAIVDACTDVGYGEIEDYGVYIVPGAAATNSPALVSSPSDQRIAEGTNTTFACGVTGFHLTYAWQVDEGNGFAAITNGGYYSGADTDTLTISNVPAALHGNFYRCHVSNAYGNVTSEEAILTIIASTASACAPDTVNTGNFGTGVVRVQFIDIDNAHDDFLNDGFSDFSSTANTMVSVGTTNPLTVTLSGGNPEYCRVYIDYDNSGAFDAGEMVYNASSRATSHTTEIIASPATLSNAFVRMRIISDFSTIVGPCNDVNYGEVEDYGLYFIQQTDVTLQDLSQTYDGTAKSVTALTDPTNLATRIKYNGDTAEPTNAGSYIVTAVIIDPNYTGNATDTLTIAKATQTITFEPLPEFVPGDNPYILTASADSGLPVSYASDTPSVASVAGKTVTIVSTGTTAITASQIGDSNYFSASDVDRNLVVAQSSADLTGANVAGDAMTIAMQGNLGRIYNLLSNSNLLEESWNILQVVTNLPGPTLNIEIPLTNSSLFYRLEGPIGDPP